MTTQTIACSRCGGPTVAHEWPPELEKWLNHRPRWQQLLRLVCDNCARDAETEDARQAADLAQREAAQAERARRELQARRLREVGVPPHLRGYGFGDIDMPAGLDAALQLARDWADGNLAGLGLIGPVGTGKTRVGVAAANEACARARVRWYSAPVLVSRLGSGQFKTREFEHARATVEGRFPLVLDDLSMARPTEFAAEALYKAVDARADGAGQLLVTTNMTGEQLAKRYGDYGPALSSRLGLLTWVRVGGKDKRGNR